MGAGSRDLNDLKKGIHPKERERKELKERLAAEGQKSFTLSDAVDLYLDRAKVRSRTLLMDTRATSVLICSHGWIGRLGGLGRARKKSKIFTNTSRRTAGIRSR